MRSARSEVCLLAGRRAKLLATASLVNIMGWASFNASGYAGPVSARADPSSRQRYMSARSKTVSLAPTPRGSRAARQNREKQQFRCHTASSRHGTCCTHTAAARTLLLQPPFDTLIEHKPWFYSVSMLDRVIYRTNDQRHFSISFEMCHRPLQKIGAFTFLSMSETSGA